MNNTMEGLRKMMVQILCLLLLVASCSCEDPIEHLKIGKSVQKEEGGKSSSDRRKPKLPEMGAYQAIKVKVEELSGLCFTKDSSAFWAVGDEGDLCKVSFSGAVTPVLSLDIDTEGITLNPANGDLYIAVEGDQMVCRIAAPDYNKVDTLFYIQEALQRNFDNNGLEGISFYKDSLLFVGSQEDALLWTCKLDGTIVARLSLMEETSLIEEVAGLSYDPPKKWLWVSDSDACKIFLFSTETFDLLASYDVSFIDNAESICVDRPHNCIWVGSDEDDPILYKINFKF